MLSSRRNWHFAAVLVFLLPAACSSAGPKAAPQENFSTVGPLDAYEALNSASVEAERIGWEAGEGAMAECMKDEGFTYFQTSWQVHIDTMENPPDNLKAVATKAAKEQGYGISIGYTPGPGFISEAARMKAEYLDSLTEAERHAYDFAMFGVDSEHASEFGESPSYPQDNEHGCYGVSENAIRDAAKTSDMAAAVEASDAFYAILAGEKLNFWEQVQVEPDVQAAHRHYGECLADAGFPGFDYDNQPALEVSRRMSTLAQDGTATPDPAALKKLQEFELAVHAADETCMAAVDQVERQEINKRQQEVVNRNKKQLDAWVEMYGPG